jgi:hypothetical protein
MKILPWIIGLIAIAGIGVLIWLSNKQDRSGTLSAPEATAHTDRPKNFKPFEFKTPDIGLSNSSSSQTDEPVSTPGSRMFNTPNISLMKKSTQLF